MNFRAKRKEQKPTSTGRWDDQTRSHDSQYQRSAIESDCLRHIRHPQRYSCWKLWLASGQSNMGFSIQSPPTQRKPVNLSPTLHFAVLKSVHTSRMSRLQTSEKRSFSASAMATGDDGKWRTVDNERHGLDWICAVAARFGHEIRISQDVPVGIIESHFGGSKLYCWMPRESLENSPNLLVILLSPISGSKRKSGTMRTLPGKTIQIVIPTDRRQNHGSSSCLYNAMIAPIAPLAMRGSDLRRRIQSGKGRSISKTATHYGQRMAKTFKQNDLAFLAVQLPLWESLRLAEKSMGRNA